MTADHSESTVTMTIDDSPKGYKLLLPEGNSSKFRYSVHELRKNPFKVAAVCFGLLCLLLLAVVIGQRVHYRNTEEDHQNRYNAMTKEKDNLQDDLKTEQKKKNELQVIQNHFQDRYNVLNKAKDQLDTNIKILTKDRDDLQLRQSQLETSNTALVKEINQLKVSQSQMQANNDALTKAKDLLQTGYDLAIKQKNELQNSYNSVTKERDNLQNKFNNLTRYREEQQKSYNSLMKDVEQLESRYNSSTFDKEKLESSHSNVSKEKDILQASYNILVKASDKLQDSYTGLIDERDQIEIRYKNATAEKEQLKMINDNLTAERDKLLKEIQRLNATIAAKKCPPGWNSFEYSCYFTSAGKNTWTASRQDCQNKGADLVIINSPEEMTFINGLYGSDKEVWIGLTDEGVEGQWKWVDGTPMTTAYWGKDQPNSYNGRDQDCVEFWHHSTGQGNWNDENCNLQQHWICEK
ncbi:hypothetical protein LDENG_00216970 [Lucifuga dentata]|nr:hypothetical protein LDENG_00216970 [Lucifuga dentata]